MNVTSIFLDPKSLEETMGSYGIVAQVMNTVGTQQRFTDQYLFKPMLVDEIQRKANEAAQAMAELPPDADRVEVTTAWRVLNDLLNEMPPI